MSDRLAGKVALVTGIGAGIGRGCALVFAREGAKVFGCDIDTDRALATVAAARAAGIAMDSAQPIDLTRPADVRRCVDQVIQRHGRIDVVVNAAAINPQFAPVADMSYEGIWVPTMVGETDLVFLMCQAVWPHLLAGGGGSIVNFASVARDARHRNGRYARSLRGEGRRASDDPPAGGRRRPARNSCQFHLPRVGRNHGNIFPGADPGGTTRSYSS